MSDQPRRQLSLLDTTCLIAGIIIGAGIFQVAPTVAATVDSVWALLGLWLAGGIISLCGALGYAELASAWPRTGGDYVYLTKAYGRWAGFQFGWLQLVVARPGDIALMAFAFATYAQALWGPVPGCSPAWSQPVYATGAVAVLTIINMLGLRQGKWTQNVLTVVKALGLLGVVAAGVTAAVTGRATPVAATGAGGPPVSLGLILVMFSFGGWCEMAYVAAEVRHPGRNLLRAVLLGTGVVTGLYLLTNTAFLAALGHGGLAGSQAAATDTVAKVLPMAGALISALICISALGACNGLILTGARISYAVGAHHRLFRGLGRWNARTQVPVRALLVQGVLAIALILSLRTFLDAIIYTAAVVYAFYLATTLAVVVLRVRRPEVARPYRVTLFPLPTLLFAGVCGYLIYAAIVYKPYVALVALGLMLLGGVVYACFGRDTGAPGEQDAEDAHNTGDEA